MDGPTFGRIDFAASQANVHTLGHPLLFDIATETLERTRV